MASFTVRGKSVRLEFTQHTGEVCTATARGKDLDDSWRLASQWAEDIEHHYKAEKVWLSPKQIKALDAKGRIQQVGPPVDQTLSAWLVHHLERGKGEYTNSVRAYRSSVSLFRRFLQEAGKSPAEVPCGELDEDDVRAFIQWLRDPATAQHQKRRADSSVEFYVAAILAGLRWAAAHKDFGGEWVSPSMPADIEWEPRARMRIPTVHMTARVTLAASGWVRQALVLAYYTGLRASQVMGLRWGDVDLGRGDLNFPGRLGKSKQERRGRRVPMSPHLVKELRQWAVDGGIDHAAVQRTAGPYIVDISKERWKKETKAQPRKQKSTRELRGPTVRRIWQDLKLWDPAYSQPVHCFRASVANGLVMRGAKVAAVSHLLGHSLGIFTIERYTEADDSLRPDMLRAVAMIPQLEVAARDAAAGEVPPSLARILGACADEHQGALAALASGNLPAGRGAEETAVLLRSLAEQLDELRGSSGS